jgi:hypothetical protein
MDIWTRPKTLPPYLEKLQISTATFRTLAAREGIALPELWPRHRTDDAGYRQAQGGGRCDDNPEGSVARSQVTLAG